MKPSTETEITHREPAINWQLWRRAALFIAIICSMTLMPDSNENLFASNLLTSVVTTIIHQEEIENATQISSELTKNNHEQKNLNYESYLSIIQTSIQDLRRTHPDIKVTWNKSADYLSDEETLQLLLTPVHDGEQPTFDQQGQQLGSKHVGEIPAVMLFGATKDPNLRTDLYLLFYNRLTPKIQDAINTANTNMTALPGTQLYESDMPANSNVVPFDKVDTYYESFKQDLDTLWTQQSRQKLFSQSELLSYFLEKAGGHLEVALANMSGFIKYMIRGDDSDHIITQIEWLKTHVQDQLNSSFSLNDLPLPSEAPLEQKDPLLSIWGLQYHAPHLIFLLSYLSPELVKGAGLYEYVTHQHVAAAYKIDQDIKVMDELNGIFAYLQTLEPTS